MTKPAGQRAVQGDSIRDVVTTSRWNAVMDMLDEWQRTRGQFAVTPGESASSSCEIEVYNDTTEDLDRWACVGLADVTVVPSENEDEFVERHVVKAKTIGPQHANKFAILQEAIPAGEIGRAVVCGKTIATVNVIDAAHQYATPESGQHRLSSSTAGPCRIFYAEEPGVVSALVVIGQGLSSEVDTGGPNDTTLINGCDINDCLTPGETWVDTISGDEDCEAVPHELEFGGGLNLLSGAPRGCCEGRIWNEVDFPEDSYIIRGGPMVLTRTTGKQWVGPWFECPDLLNQATDCGPARWRWTVGSTTLNCTYSWSSRAVTCSGVNIWIWDEVSPGPPPVFDWSYVGNSCECSSGGFEPPARPDGTGPYNGYVLELPCYSTSEWEWYLASGPGDGCPEGATCTGPDADPDGGSLGPPSSPPTGSGQNQTFECSISVPAEGAWVLETDCLCGTAVAPTEPGLYDGQLMTTECLSPTDGGGYSEELTVRWRLNADLDTPKLELVDADGTVYFVYVLAPPRPFCCLCANPFVFAGCGPLYRCPPYGAICVRPHVPNRCRVAPGCDATRVEISLSGFAGYSRLSSTTWTMPAGWDPALHLGLVNGTWRLTPDASVGGCIASRQWVESVEVDGEPTDLTITIGYRAGPGGLSPGAPAGSCWDGVEFSYPAVTVWLNFGDRCILAVFTPSGAQACGTATTFALELSTVFVTPFGQSIDDSEVDPSGLVEVTPV